MARQVSRHESSQLFRLRSKVSLIQNIAVENAVVSPFMQFAQPPGQEIVQAVLTFDCDVVCMVRLADALSMAKSQEDILKRWRNISGGAPDEIVVPSELVARNKSVRTCICAFCA